MSIKQSIPLKSVQNARELGGYMTSDGRKIKSGVLLRTAGLNGMSEEDIKTLKDDYRLSDIVDFRMDMELPGAEDPAIDGVGYHHLDVIDIEEIKPDDAPEVDITGLDPLKIAEITIQSGMLNNKMYIGFLSCETGKKAYSEFFRILLGAEPDRAVLWHCTSGKDRTGLAAMLLLSALGVEEDVIIDDFILTNTYYAPRIDATRSLLKSKGCDDAFINMAVLVFDAVDGSFMQNAIAYLKKEYGSVCGYIRDGLNIDQDEINSLKEKYLT